MILHLTDGAATDGDPLPVANQLRQIETGDGNVLLMNIHITGGSKEILAFPSNIEHLPSGFTKSLFEMSSVLPPPMIDRVSELGYEVSDTSRAYMFNAKYEDVVKFFEMGTKIAIAMIGPGASANSINLARE